MTDETILRGKAITLDVTADSICDATLKEIIRGQFKDELPEGMLH